MKCSIRTTIPLVTLAVLAGCAGATPIGYNATTPSAAPVNAYVLDREHLGGREGALLDAMIGRVPGFRVASAASCPAVTLRGRVNTAPGITDPLVYVDGARALDACVLEMLRARDVERVEVYPMGVTTRSGYQGNANGLILVFTRQR